jgi:large conductance mechanosensitive channel
MHLVFMQVPSQTELCEGGQAPAARVREQIYQRHAEGDEGMFKEFRDFAMRGNVVDLAVGLIIGAAFGAIITSLVGDIIMPVVGVATGGVDFSALAYVLKPASVGIDGKEIAAVTINYGKFFNFVITFLIVAFAMFLLIKGMNKMKKKQEEAPAAPPPPAEEVVLLTQIRDLLKR